MPVKAIRNDEIDALVHIVDDDVGLRTALSSLLKSISINSVTYNSAEDFFNSLPHENPGCILLDVRMDGMGGLELQKKLSTYECHLPIIFLTGHGTVQNAIKAIKRGAYDFLEKPVDTKKLIKVVTKALDKNINDIQFNDNIQRLTSREKEVFEGLAKGQINKKISHDLKISIRTIEFHRSNIMKKLEVDTLEELIELKTALNQISNPL